MFGINCLLFFLFFFLERTYKLNFILVDILIDRLLGIARKLQCFEKIFEIVRSSSLLLCQEE